MEILVQMKAEVNVEAIVNNARDLSFIFCVIIWFNYRISTYMPRFNHAC